MIEFKYKFVEDATDLLAEIEQTLLNLEKNPNDSMLIEEVFRAMHTLKGTAGMFGFEEIGTFTHKLENIYDLVRNGRITINKSILQLTLQAVDFLNKALKSTDQEDYTQEYKQFYTRIDDIHSSVDENIFDGNKIEMDNIMQHSTGIQTWFITIKPTTDPRKRGIKMHIIFDEIDEAGQNHIYNRTKTQTNDSGLFWEILLATDIPETEIEDILLFIEDISEINHLAEGNLFDNEKFIVKLNEFEKQPFIDIDELKLFVEQHHTAEEENSSQTQQTIKIESHKLESIKVPAQRLDEQMTLLSELVTTKAEIQLIVERSGYKNLIKSVERINKITRRFRKNIFKIRLIPLETMHLRFDRLIRDLSMQLGKEVEFVTEGMQTELDKNIIDSLESPIMHLIRNSLDHGVETADIRKMRGKQGKGQIKLSARQVATNVIITVSDDGEGINTTHVVEKAIQKGIISKTDKLSNSEIFNLIFVAGFSTAKNLTEVSGRGVGMDVVKQTINKLRGSIEIQSEKGKGSSFIIKLPLTLSIIDTMLVKSGIMYYSIPLSEIEKCTEIKTSVLNNHDNNVVEIDGKLLPFIIINEKLKTKTQNSKTTDETNQKSKIVIVHNETQETALIVDEVIGEHQAVLKPLGDYFITQKYISGASQLADGHVALVLDTSQLIAFSQTQTINN